MIFCLIIYKRIYNRNGYNHKRVVCRNGVISVKTEELKNAKAESIEIKQSILGTILARYKHIIIK